jgi:hypothetical protein
VKDDRVTPPRRPTPKPYGSNRRRAGLVRAGDGDRRITQSEPYRARTDAGLTSGKAARSRKRGYGAERPGRQPSEPHERRSVSVHEAPLHEPSGLAICWATALSPAVAKARNPPAARAISPEQGATRRAPLRLRRRAPERQAAGAETSRSRKRSRCGSGLERLNCASRIDARK